MSLFNFQLKKKRKVIDGTILDLIFNKPSAYFMSTEEITLPHIVFFKIIDKYLAISGHRS